MRHCYILSTPELVKEAKTSGIDVQQVEDDLKSFFIYIQNAIKGLENGVKQKFDDVAYSLENSQKKCQKVLQHSQGEIVAVIQELCKVSASKFFDTSNVERLLAQSRDLLERPDTVHTKRPTKGTEKIVMPSIEWLQMLESQMNFDFGQPGEIYLVKNALESDDADICDSTTAPLMISSGASDIGDTFERTSHASLTLSERSAACQRSQRRPSKTSSVQSVQLPVHSNREYFAGGVRRCESVNGVNQPLASNTRTSRGRHPSPVQISGPSLTQCGINGSPRIPYNPKTSCSRITFVKPDRYKEGWKGTVVISHVNSPSNFYVQHECSLQTFENYRDYFKSANRGPPVDKQDIKIGNMYLTECSDGEWYRVRVTEMSPDGRSVWVIQIDTGEKVVVDITRILRIEDTMEGIVNESELAIQCSIHNCCPVASTWQREDIDTFIEAVKDRKVTMTVQNVLKSKLEVDLEWDHEGSLTSMRGYLQALGKACITLRKENQSTITLPNNLKYFKDTRFEPNEWVPVKVTHVYGPNDFYITRIDPRSEKILEEMNKTIDCFYKDKDNYKQYPVATPCIGLPVAAQYTVDNTWYRAELLNSYPQTKKAEVLYVDFGNKETLPLCRIRLLAKEFTKNTVQTVKCSLAGIKPLTGSKYKYPASAEFLIKNVEDKELQMVVNEVKDGELSVVLYRSDEDEDVCINLLLVDHEFAKKVGDVLGAASSYPKKNNVDAGKQVMIVKKVPQETQPDTSEKANSEKSEEVTQHTSTEIAVLENNKAESSDEEIADEESEVLSGDDVLQGEYSNSPSDQKPRWEVKVVSFISPNLCHISLVVQLGTIHEMIGDMTKFYREKKNNPELILSSITTETRCAAYSEKDDKWYRAKVTEIKENGDVTVFFKDIAREETVKKEYLYSLPQQFGKFIDGTVACHMVNIEDRSEWPEDLCESFRNSLDSYNSIYVVKMTKEPNRTLPVELWGKTVSCGGAFAPSTEEWTNLNQLLMKALEKDDLVEPDPESDKDKQSRKKSSQNLDDDIGEISSTETVKKWLHCNVVEASKKGVQYGRILANGGEIPDENSRKSDSPTKSSARAIDTVKKLEISAEKIPQPDWKPAERIEIEEFEACPTYVDDDFCVYLQTTGKQKKMITMISDGLQSRFTDSTPSPHDMHWYPGQICIAWFFVDKKWYRGKVLKVEESKAYVEYVDYGNTEWVEFSYLRKDVILQNFPIQCHKFPIRSDLIPVSGDGKWTQKTLDFVHAQLIERNCTVKLKKEKGENFHRIEKLTYADGTDVEVFDFLCDLGYTKFAAKSDKKPIKTIVDSKSEKDRDGDDQAKDDDCKSNSSSSIAKFDSVSNVDLSEFLEVPGATIMVNDPFSIPQNPQENEIIIPFFEVPVHDLNIVTVEVIEILQVDEIVVHIVDCDNVAVSENRQHFDDMSKELQKEGIEQPKLKSLSLGRMCCTYFIDGTWYRAKIIDLEGEDGKVNILYVDYGNSSHADPSTLHEMKRSWFDVPMQSIRCKVEDYSGIVSDGKEPDLDENMLPLISKRFEAVLEACDDSRMLYKIQLFFK
ncbi:tudor domain-containing protein 1 isoform X2 [Planococcus citri]|uniref:tudor domain-containing protein 1 isoform X2 n=1 Tax=Planococcus citri TaxID=170843 RepID=UPI0031F784C3